MTLPNNVIFLPEKVGVLSTGQARDLHIHPFLESLITNFAIANPKWLFAQRSVHYNYSEGADAYISSFSVHDGDIDKQAIGTISVDKRYANGVRENVFEVFSQRLAKDRERGHVYRTKDSKLAAKAIKKYFNPAPIAERLDELYVRGRHMGAVHFNEITRDLRIANDVVFPMLQQFASDNWELFSSKLDSAQYGQAAEMMARKQTHQEATKLANCLGQAGEITLLIESDKYIMRYNNAITVWVSEELPHDFRGNIGLLKLLEVGDILDGKGIRVGDNAFILLPTEDFLAKMAGNKPNEMQQV